MREKSLPFAPERIPRALLAQAIVVNLRLPVLTLPAFALPAFA